MTGKTRALLITVAVLVGLFTSVSTHAAPYTFSSNLREGVTSADVSALQDCLADAGYFHHVTTGYFGAITFSSVEAWQTANGVPSTGYFGPLSRASAATGTLCSSNGASISAGSSTTSSTSTSTSLTSTINGREYINGNGKWVLITGNSGGGSASAPPAVSVSVSPSSVTLDTRATTTFAAAVTNSVNTSVNWSATGGTVDASGLYTAPQSVAATTTYVVTATSAGDATKSGTATVTVLPVIVSVVPSATTTLAGTDVTFNASVANATTSTVTWSVTGGSISSSGVFSAPGVTATTTYTITASSTVDTTRAGTASVEVTPDSSFVGWWKLNEGTGTEVYDISGNGNNGTWSGSTAGNTAYYDTNAAPTFSYAGAFDGTSTAVTIPNINISAAQTISFWAYIPNLNGTTELVSKSSGGQGVEVIVANGTLNFYVMGSAVINAVASASDIHVGSWNYVTATYGGPNTTMTIYINGLASGSTATAPVTVGNATNLYFGTWNSGNRFFDGKLNDIRLYTKELSPSDILSLYNSY